MNQKELYHHGIIGQRWGVRRYQNKDGTLTSKGKKHYKSDDIVFTKGQAQSHISTQRTIKMKNRSTYTMHKKEDMRIYGGTYGAALINRQKIMKKDPKIYAHVFINKYSNVVAGEKAMRDTFNNIYKKHNKLLVKAMQKDYETYLKRGQIKDNISYEDFSKNEERMFKLFTKTSLNYYSSADSSGNLQRIPHESYIIGKMYTESLQKQKYSGMIDLNDKGTWYGANSPTVIFNGKKYLKESYVTELPLSTIVGMTNKIKDEGRVNMQLNEAI